MFKKVKNLILKLFSLSIDVPKVEELPFKPKLPEVGEKWANTFYCKKVGDPFPQKRPPVFSTILEVKEGWVRYKIGEGTLYPDERQPLKNFLACYSYLPEFNK